MTHSYKVIVLADLYYKINVPSSSGWIYTAIIDYLLIKNIIDKEEKSKLYIIWKSRNKSSCQNQTILLTSILYNKLKTNNLLP